MLNLHQFQNQPRPLILSRNKFLLLMTLGSSLGLILFLSPAKAQIFSQLQSETDEPSETQTSDDVGWEFPGNRELNQASITEIEYEGECPGKEASSQQARFTSSQTPPALGRRVIVRNVTRGVASAPYPYTDRKYTQGRASEPTRMAFGNSHSSKRLNVLEGENIFEYEIKQGDRVIDSGSFSAVIEKEVDVRKRDAIASQQSVCMNSAVPLDLCADIRTRTEYKCPNSFNVLRAVMEPNSPSVSTTVSNQTFSDISYMVNGEMQRLPSGSERKYTGNSLTIEFQPGCTTGGCQPNEILELQPGRRYKFSASNIDNGLVELVDFPRL